MNDSKVTESGENTPARVTITFLLFGILREKCGQGEVSLDLRVATVAEAVQQLFKSVAAFADWEPGAWQEWLRVATGDEYIAWHTPVFDNMELALIPPVSGGQFGDRALRLAEPVVVELRREELELLPAVKASDYGDQCGSFLCFDGIVRADPVLQGVTRIHYEAHEPMALNIMHKLATEVYKNYGLLGIHMMHRTGEVEVGLTAIRVCIASRHRQEGIAALAELMQKFKAEVPLFKKEIGSEGTSRWVGLNVSIGGNEQ